MILSLLYSPHNLERHNACLTPYRCISYTYDSSRDPKKTPDLRFEATLFLKVVKVTIFFDLYLYANSAL